MITKFKVSGGREEGNFRRKGFVKLSASVMNIDIFGHSSIGDSHLIQSPPSGIPFTATGDYNIEKRRLCNIGTAVEPDDAVNVDHLNKTIEKINGKLENKVDHEVLQFFKVEIRGKIQRLEDYMKKVYEGLQLML